MTMFPECIHTLHVAVLYTRLKYTVGIKMYALRSCFISAACFRAFYCSTENSDSFFSYTCNYNSLTPQTLLPESKVLGNLDRNLW